MVSAGAAFMQCRKAADHYRLLLDIGSETQHEAHAKAYRGHAQHAALVALVVSLMNRQPEPLRESIRQTASTSRHVCLYLHEPHIVAMHEIPAYAESYNFDVACNFYTLQYVCVIELSSQSLQ